MALGGLQIGVDHDSGVTRVHVAGELDLATVPALVEAVSQGTPPGGSVELDLREVSFIDSAGIAGINRCRRHAADVEAGIRLLARDGGSVAQLIEWTGLASVMDVELQA